MGYFCAALIEATRKGTSISDVLESQAKLARKARYDALTAHINKLSTKMAVPLVFFLIAVLVLILPPLIIPTACSWKSCNRKHQLNDMKQPGCRFAPRLLSFSHHNPGHTGNFLQSAAL